jgi:hypothetical protein
MLTRLEIEALAALVLVTGALAGLHFYDAHQRALGAAAVTSAVQKAAAKAEAVNAARAASVAAEQATNLREANNANFQHQADARGLDAIVQRLHDSAARGGSHAAPTARPAGASQPDKGVPSAGMVPADVYLRAVDAARDASEYADCLSTAGRLCAADYSSLTNP